MSNQLMSSIKFGVEKFDGRINFGLWQVQVKDVLIQSGLHKALKGRPSNCSSDEKSGGAVKSSDGSSSGDKKSSIIDDVWEDMDLRAASAIRLCLAKNVLANVHGISTAKELWEKLEALYQAKGISNRLYLKEQFHTLRMEEGTKISDHLSVLNGVISELEAIEVKIDDEDKALRLILSLPSSYEHMKPILMYGKEALNFAEVTGKLLSEERRLTSEGRTSHGESMLLVTNSWKKKKDLVRCWECGQTGHIKNNCPKRAGSSKGFESDANNVSFSMGDMGDDAL